MATSAKAQSTTNGQVLQAMVNDGHINFADYSLEYPDRIDEWTQEQIASVADRWLSYPANRIAITEALQGLITEESVNSMVWENPLAEFEGPDFPYGETERETYVNFAQGYRYNPFASVGDAFRIYRAYVTAVYHHVNWEMQYAVTISRKDLRKAFFNQYGFQRLIEAKINSLRGGYNWDSYITALELVEIAATAGHMYTVNVPAVTNEATALSFLVELKAYAKEFETPDLLFNPAGATSFTERGGANLVLITTARIFALIDVYARSKAFNAGFLDNPARRIIIQRFNNTAIQAAMMDIRWWHIRKQDEDIDEQHNAAAGYTNHFLTGIKMVSYSPFYPAVVFTTATSTVTGVTVTGGTVEQGGEIMATVTVTGTNAYQNYELELTGQTSAKTVLVPFTNVVVVGDDELATELTLTATSRVDTSITGTGTITVTPATRRSNRLGLGGK